MDTRTPRTVCRGWQSDDPHFDMAQELRSVMAWEEHRMGSVSAAVLEGVIKRIEAGELLEGNQPLTVQKPPPQWVTSWPEWFGLGPLQNVTVVPKDDYDTLELNLAAANERLRAERSLVIELIKRDALIDWAGGSTGSALGTRDRIVGALELFYECRAALAGKP